MSDWVVYWLHDAYCIKLQEHGYVGISAAFMTRLAVHQRNKRFPSNFEWSIIFTGTKAECLALEHQLRPDPGIGWNKNPGGTPTVVLTDEVRAKMSLAAKSRPPISDETREKLRITSIGRTNRGRLGQKKSAEERAKIAASKTGKTLSEKHCRNIGLAKLGNKNRLGGSLSTESRQQISLKKRGVPIHTEEHKEKLRERMKGNSFTKGQPWSAARRLAWLANKEK